MQLKNPKATNPKYLQDNPIISSGVRPTDKVGVIGIGGLGHMAIKLLKHWGCEVVAFSSNPVKKNQTLEWELTRSLIRPPQQISKW